MPLCDKCRNELPDVKCKNCDEIKSIDNFKSYSKVCSECNKTRYDAWKEVNSDKWKAGGKYYKYKKKD